MTGYKTETENDPEEEEGEKNLKENRKDPATYPIGRSCGWEKINRGEGTPKKSGNLGGYTTGLSNKPE